MSDENNETPGDEEASTTPADETTASSSDVSAESSSDENPESSSDENPETSSDENPETSSDESPESQADSSSESSSDSSAESDAEPAETDYMAEMAAAMEADGVTVEDNTTESESGVDHMAAMMAAMEADGVTVEKDIEESSPVDQNTQSSTALDAEAIARSVSSQNINIDTLLQVPIALSIEVGRTKMILGDLLETQEGTVIELERLLDEPLDILVNGALIAHGVIVLSNENFGIQITDIISLEERARSL